MAEKEVCPNQSVAEQQAGCRGWRNAWCLTLELSVMNSVINWSYELNMLRLENLSSIQRL